MKMRGTPRKSPGERNIAAKWDSMDAMSRLNLIRENSDLFWAMRLVTRSEIAMMDAMHESAREYVVSREDQPLFTSINLKKEIAAQTHRDKLKAALKAVFSKKK